MRTKEELQQSISEILKQVRSSSHLSIAKMAARMNLTERTYARYESGESCPTLADFIVMMDRANVPVLPTIKRYLYPEHYSGGTDDLRHHLADYILNTASDRDVEQMHYLLNGSHGSTSAAQLQLFTLLDHLPLDSRLMAAKVAYNAFDIELARGHIINAGTAMPDMELLHNALVKATQAVIEGRDNYTSSIK